MTSSTDLSGLDAAKLDPGLEALIRSLHRTAPNRVFSAHYNGARLWVKTVAAPRLRSSVLMQKAIATIFGLPVLQPARNRGGAQGLADEAAALRALAAAGFPVPPVIACTPDWLVLGDAGEALENKLNSLRDRAPDDCWGLIAAAGALLARLHGANLWHGGAQIRNFSWHHAAPGLLDFEDHDLPGMTLAEKQARDLLLFVYSLTRYDRDAANPRLPALASDLLRQATPDVRDSIHRLRRRMAWLLALARWLAPHAGRDVRQAAAADAALAAALKD
jgi:tRNA A-37 threonylcarbamoyl transferase component Bud32